MIDLHSHLIPGIDDGASTLDAAVAAVAEMRRDGITHIVTTPHLRLSLLSQTAAFAEYMERMDAGWAILVAACGERFPEIKLARGVELALDSLPRSLTDERLFLAGTRFMLVEFPHFRVPLNSEFALQALVADGIVPILAHPERYLNLGTELGVVRAWRKIGALTQVNAGSVTGQYGQRPRELAEAMIAGGLVDYLSSDHHARGTCKMGHAVRVLAERELSNEARQLTEVNAARLLRGELPGEISGSSAPQPGSWRRFIRRLSAR